ncbi:uncharacterized protein [Henckelia pumila]|uniref:uncharacterized protein n=1 Tax=Henckelia pumila TaxID=405737 RepID=UPI003C6E70B9
MKKSKGKKPTSTATAPVPESEDEPNEEMLAKFADNRPQPSENSSSDSSKEYQVNSSNSSAFYSKEISDCWENYADREFLEEHNIDVESYGAQNMVRFFEVRNILSTVTTAGPYCRELVREFYCNLTEAVKDPRYMKYGKVYVRGQIFSFSPIIINGFLQTPASDDDALPTMDEMTSVITGGHVTIYPAHPKKFPVAKLTSFYSVLHKTAVKTWTPSENSSVVTKHQALVLYAIGTGIAFNFGRVVFDTVMAFAYGAQPILKLPYPSLIYSMLLSQEIEKDDDVALIALGELLKIAPALLKGNRKIDLSWSESADAAGVVAAQLVHVEQKIAQEKADLAYYEGLKAHYESVLSGAGPSEQKGREGSEVEETESESNQF